MQRNVCTYVNFNYIVICDADKMSKYCSVVGCLSNSTYKIFCCTWKILNIIKTPLEKKSCYK